MVKVLMKSVNDGGVTKRIASDLLKAKIPLLLSMMLSSYAFGNNPVESTTVHGTITDASTGEYVYGANIFLRGTTIGTVSNIEGFYSMPNLPPGEYTLIVTFIGFSKHEESFELRKGKSLRMDVDLSPVDIEGETVIVTDELSKFEHNINISTISISPRQIKSLPSIGEVDLFRALQFLPGVAAQNDYSSGLIVRGGNTDQNLILLDGITVYNPSHLGGFFSTFITEGLREAELMKGGYSAEYGGRLSSVLDIKTKDGNNKRFAGSAEISLVSSKLLLEAPIGNGGWLFAGRRTYIDKALDASRKLGISDFEFPYYFYDLQANIYQDLSPNDRLRISAYYGNDVLDWEEATANINWGNRTISTRWRHLFSDQLFSTFMIARSKFSAHFNFGGEDAFRGVDRVRDWTAKGDLTYFRTEDHEISFGTELKDLKVEFFQSFDSRELIRIDQSPKFFAFYVNSRLSLPGWVIQTGLRSTYYNDSTDRLTFSPRVSIKKVISNFNAFNFSIGRYYQYIYTFNDEFSFNIINQWFAIDKSVPNQYADQIMFGYETTFSGFDRVTIESYYKKMNNLLVGRPEFATFDEQLINPAVADIFAVTEADAFGVELFFEKKVGAMNGNFSYAHSYVIKQIEDEPKYWANWDRRHTLKGVMNYHKSKSTQFGFSWVYTTGFPFTQQLGSYAYWEPEYRQPDYDLIPGSRNNSRLPYNNRIDFSITKHKKIKGAKVDYYLQIINVLNRKNLFAVSWDIEDTENGKVVERNDLRGIPLFPTIGIRMEF
ncbi:MAG: TonB-dependent receptor [Candidatus Marinimicrobia bacterium]|nr:TonB-dependent receptor [Candidatus Neomarinimicrobiota bacterium]